MKIVEAKPINRFQVFLRFSDGAAGVVDLGHLAGRGVFQAWDSEGLFEQLFVNANGALEWPGELDLCPDSLYLLMLHKAPESLFPALKDSFAHA